MVADGRTGPPPAAGRSGRIHRLCAAVEGGCGRVPRRVPPSRPAGPGGRMTPGATDAPGPTEQRAQKRGRMARLDAFQQRHRATAVVGATMAKYRDDRANLLANLLA